MQNNSLEEIQAFEKFLAAAAQIETAETDDFVELMKLSGLDPKTDLVGADLSGVDFGSDDLSCANLSHADLTGANLSNANVAGALMNGVLGLSSADKLDLIKRGAIFNSD